jgi:hypothetical protein
LRYSLNHFALIPGRAAEPELLAVEALEALKLRLSEAVEPRDSRHVEAVEPELTLELTHDTKALDAVAPDVAEGVESLRAKPVHTLKLVPERIKALKLIPERIEALKLVTEVAEGVEALNPLEPSELIAQSIEPLKLVPERIEPLKLITERVEALELVSQSIEARETLKVPLEALEVTLEALEVPLECAREATPAEVTPDLGEDANRWSARPLRAARAPASSAPGAARVAVVR